MRVTPRGLLQAAAAVTVLFSLGTLVPVDHFTVQMFTHFRLQYTIIAFLLCIAFVVMREGRYAVVLLGAAAVNASFVVPWYTDAPPEMGASELTLLNANVHARNGAHQKLLDLIAAEQPDLVVLQEVTPEWAKSLQHLAADYPHRLVEPRDGSFGIALLSRYPLSSSVSIDSGPGSPPILVATVNVDGVEIAVIGVHPVIPLPQRNFEARNAQLQRIGRLLQKSQNPRILIGDLNVTMWDLHYESLENRTWLRNARRGFGVVPTWPTFLPFAMIPIDHVLVSEDLGVVDVRTGPRIGSDHLPLIVTLTL
ncbi:MAG: endonuclease/exonuclease/phosphatase family protein [Gammaproteobacteria bacterium]|nr:endonuclease/exonuclease/phosphatase family protein [Gammaproteobacteria bacterium]